MNAIKVGEPVPAPADRMVKVQMLSDMPAGQRPVIKVIDTKSAYFKALAAKEKAAKGDEFTPCDVTMPSLIK